MFVIWGNTVVILEDGSVTEVFLPLRWETKACNVAATLRADETVSYVPFDEFIEMADVMENGDWLGGA